MRQTTVSFVVEDGIGTEVDDNINIPGFILIFLVGAANFTYCLNCKLNILEITYLSLVTPNVSIIKTPPDLVFTAGKENFFIIKKIADVMLFGEYN